MGTELLNLLIGAGLAMTAQAFIQLRVVPRVEARKRREDRWERDLLTFGQLLTAELPQRAHRAKTDQWILQMIASDQTTLDIDAEIRAKVIDQRLDHARRSTREYLDIADIQLSWLVKRIVSIAPKNTKLVNFENAYTTFYMSATLCALNDAPDDNFNEEKHEETWKREGEFRQRLTSMVDELLNSVPPRNQKTKGSLQIKRRK